MQHGNILEMILYNGAIFISWTQWADHATNAKYTFTGLGNSAPNEVTVNQY
jgi:hypothetical protein